MANVKGKALTKNQAAKMYKALKETLIGTKTGSEHAGMKDSIAKNKSNSIANHDIRNTRLSAPRLRFTNKGQKTAVTFVVLVVMMKLALSFIENTGILEADTARARMNANHTQHLTNHNAPRFSEEKIAILKQLDKKRAELVEKEEELRRQEEEIGKQKIEITLSLNELKQITDRLKLKRDNRDRERELKLKQLSKVYASMDPTEAAKLLEQLDVTIALDLLKRMPDKRVAQILALLNKDTALTITRLLTAK